MIYEIDMREAGGRFIELMATIDAGFGVLIKDGDAIIARLVPESAFHDDTAKEDGLTPEEREARETFAQFQSDIEDSF